MCRVRPVIGKLRAAHGGCTEAWCEDEHPEWYEDTDGHWQAECGGDEDCGQDYDDPTQWTEDEVLCPGSETGRIMGSFVGSFICAFLNFVAGGCIPASR